MLSVSNRVGNKDIFFLLSCITNCLLKSKNSKLGQFLISSRLRPHSLVETKLSLGKLIRFNSFRPLFSAQSKFSSASQPSTFNVFSKLSKSIEALAQYKSFKFFSPLQSNFLKLL